MQTVDEYIALREPWMQSKMESVRQILLTFPEITERIRYQVPFYDCCGMMIYMGPFKKKRLVVGFCNGIHMTNKKGLLIADAGQIQIRHYELLEDKKLKEMELIQLIKEAIKINKQLHEQKHGYNYSRRK